MKRPRDFFQTLLNNGQFCGRIETSESPAAEHELIRIGRREATCSCGVWNARSGEVLQTEITKTLNGLHAVHVRENHKSTKEEKRNDQTRKD
jgi:hypothetical protein